jgi:hypothetical protein
MNGLKSRPGLENNWKKLERRDVSRAKQSKAKLKNDCHRKEEKKRRDKSHCSIDIKDFLARISAVD